MNVQKNQDGFILITGLLILLVLTMLGIAATTNTSIELQIAGNDRLHKQTLYQAEAGAILGTELLEQNFNCAQGFEATTDANIPAKHADIRGYTRSWERNDGMGNPNGLAYWRNAEPRIWNDPAKPDDWTIKRDIYNPAEADASYPLANLDSTGDATKDKTESGYLYIGGFTEMLPGGALQMAAGYEGKGKGSSGGGVAKIIDIYSRYRGQLNSESIVLIGWRHLIGSEGSCNYGL